MVQTAIILCKNNRSAKLLFERYANLCYKDGHDFKVNRKHLAIKFGLYFPNCLSYMKRYASDCLISEDRPNAKFQPKRSTKIKNKRKKKKK